MVLDWALIKVVVIYVIFIVGLCIISEWITGGNSENFTVPTDTQAIFNSMQGQIKDEITKRLKQMKGIPERGQVHQQQSKPVVTNTATTVQTNQTVTPTMTPTVSPSSESFTPMEYDIPSTTGWVNNYFNIVPPNSAQPGLVPELGKPGVNERFTSFAYPQTYEDSVISKAKQELDTNSNAIFAGVNVVPTDIKWSDSATLKNASYADCLSPPQNYVTVDKPVNYAGMEERQGLPMNKRTLYYIDGKYKFDTSNFPNVEPIGCDF